MTFRKEITPWSCRGCFKPRRDCKCAAKPRVSERVRSQPILVVPDRQAELFSKPVVPEMSAEQGKAAGLDACRRMAESDLLRALAMHTITNKMVYSAGFIQAVTLRRPEVLRRRL